MTVPSCARSLKRMSSASRGTHHGSICSGTERVRMASSSITIVQGIFLRTMCCKSLMWLTPHAASFRLHSLKSATKTPGAIGLRSNLRASRSLPLVAIQRRNGTSWASMVRAKQRSRSLSPSALITKISSTTSEPTEATRCRLPARWARRLLHLKDGSCVAATPAAARA